MTPTDSPPPTDMSLLERLAYTGERLGTLLGNRENPVRLEIERPLGPMRALIGGRETLLFGTNNYLGLNHDPDCIAAAHAALDHYGTGSTASRVASGTFTAHTALEHEIAALYGWSQASLFSTGFMANLGVIGALAGPDDAIILDRHCHASIYDGCTMSGAKVTRFAHNDVRDLDRILSRAKIPARRTLVIVEGLYSVLGDHAPLPAIAETVRRHGAMLMVDEAHSFGLFGDRGSGLVEATGTADLVDLVTGTFSKAIGLIGGFCVSDHPQMAHLYIRSRAFMFTASLPPALVEAARVAIRKVSGEPALREQLFRNARRLHAALLDLGYEIASEPGPVIAVVQHSWKRLYDIWQALLDHGVYVNWLAPPATPDGKLILRCSVSAAHTDQDLDRAIEAFAAAASATPSHPGAVAIAGE